MTEPGPVTFIEALDLTEMARELGYRCSVSMFPDLAQRLEPRAAVTHLRDVLLATADDPKTQVFRAIVLAGERPKLRRPAIDDPQQAIRFLNRVRAGIGGISDGGTMLALHVGAVPMLCTIAPSPAVDRDPRVVLTSPPEEAESLLRRLLPY